MSRKRRKSKGQTAVSETKMIATSLEEDLRQQRVRQQEREREKLKNSVAFDNIATCSDDDAGAEIPSPSTISSNLPQHLTIQSQTTTWPEFTPNMSFLYGLAIIQQSSGLHPRKRGRLGGWTCSRYLLENMETNNRASRLYSKDIKWLDHIVPGDMHCSWDMTCKHYLHASARTLDVSIPSGGHSPRGGFGDNPHLPTIATTLQGGWGIYQPSASIREAGIRTSRCKPVHSIRLHEKSQRLGMIVRDNSSSTSYKFHFYSLPHAVNYLEAGLQIPVHDFCFGTDLAVFACPIFGGQGRKTPLPPLFLPLDHRGALRSLNVQNFPQSDALRVEMSCEREKYLAFAHRNGQVSLIDLRQSHTNCSIINSEIPTVELGSATELKFLLNQRQLLVKRSFGACQIHDLRKLSPCPTSLIRTFRPNIDAPLSESTSLHKMLSANCNGFLVDPNTQQTLISPFVNGLQQPCLGVWNMVSGDMVGAKVLDDNLGRDTFFVELSPTVTPAFDNKGRTRNSSYGAWMKCGRLSAGKINGKTGSLHHFTCPGRGIVVQAY